MSNNDALLEMTQAYLNFSDEQMDVFKTNPRNLEILPQIPNLLNTEFTFEVIEAHGCICQHKAGQKIVINGMVLYQKTRVRKKFAYIFCNLLL